MQFINKPEGGLWGSTFTPDDEYVSDWARFVYNEDFRAESYNNGLAYDMRPCAKILNVENHDSFIKLLTEVGCPLMLDSNRIFDGIRFINWDAIAKLYDAVHFGFDAVFSCRFIREKVPLNENKTFVTSNLYSYDCESWVVCNPDVIDMKSIRKIEVDSEGRLAKANWKEMWS